MAVIQVNWLYALSLFCEVTKNPNITAGKEDGNSKQSNGELVDEPCNTCLIDNSNDVSSSEGGWNIFSLTHVNAHNSVCVTMMIGTKIHPFVGLVHVIFWWLSMFKDFIQFLFLVIVSRSFIFLICHIPFK